MHLPFRVPHSAFRVPRFYEPGSNNRTVRGASWIEVNRGYLVSSDRLQSAPQYRGERYIGFRCVLGASAR
jgi:hypothetical protein